MIKSSVVLLLIFWLPVLHAAADVREEIKKAQVFGKSTSALVIRDRIRPYWAEGSAFMVYRVNDEPDGFHYIKVNLKNGEKSPAFDHTQFAKELSQATHANIQENKIPIEQIKVMDDFTIQVRVKKVAWRFDSKNHSLMPVIFPLQNSPLIAPEDVPRRTTGNGQITQITVENRTHEELEIFLLPDKGPAKSYGKIRVDESVIESTSSGHRWIVRNLKGEPLAAMIAQDFPTFASITGRISPEIHHRDDVSPDGKWRSFVKNSNLYIESTGGGDAIALSTDGHADDKFDGPFRWSPDSKKLVVFRVKPVKTRQIHIVQSSPPDQVEPKLKTIDYAKPGDAISQPMPHLFDIEKHHEINIDSTFFNNPWQIDHVAWNIESTEFRFVYNQRGHQVMRIVGIRADTGIARTLFEDVSKTFIDYSQKFYLHDLPNTHEILWASERDGHNHLYLLDSVSGAIKKQITKGNWNVREVVEVDDQKRQLLLKIMGVSGQDPYQIHFARVNFDGSGFTHLTESDGDHRITFSPDHQYLLDRWSRPDQPPATELRRNSDGKLIANLELADDGALLKTGWSRMERFVAKGRDGKTDIYGVIVRPHDFDPAKHYPVVECIYAGPQDFYVPKNYRSWSQLRTIAELGFVVVQIDGMGTNWRNKTFHDVCWKNLSDAGFPDRIPWIKAAAATRPWMDISQMAIFGGSAGGQNALGGLLFHGDFYKVGVADCGCHDNRMDKIWWNEAWMGWPLDESYARNSNVTNAHLLTGKLLLIVGEIDSNVDPASTAQVINALEQANKDFEFVPIMNSNHGAAETPYGNYRRAEFLIRNLRIAE